MNKKLFLVVGILMHTVVMSKENVQTVQSNGQNINITVQNAPEIKQEITVETPTPEEPDVTDCTKLKDKDLAYCLACQNRESFRKNMKALPDHPVIIYWRNIDNIKEYKRKLDAYENDQQYKEFYESRENKERFAPTRQQLIAGLQKVYNKGYYGNFFAYILAPTPSEKKEDLDKLIEQFEAATQTTSPMLSWHQISALAKIGPSNTLYSPQNLIYQDLLYYEALYKAFEEEKRTSFKD